MRVVSNAGPLIALGKLGQLGLLLMLYGEILIPKMLAIGIIMTVLALSSTRCTSQLRNMHAIHTMAR